MSKADRDAYVNAVLSLHSYIPDPVEGTNAYHLFVVLHRSSQAPSAHGGAGFLTWHREYLWR